MMKRTGPRIPELQRPLSLLFTVMSFALYSLVVHTRWWQTTEFTPPPPAMFSSQESLVMSHLFVCSTGCFKPELMTNRLWYSITLSVASAFLTRFFHGWTAICIQCRFLHIPRGGKWIKKCLTSYVYSSLKNYSSADHLVLHLPNICTKRFGELCFCEAGYKRWNSLTFLVGVYFKFQESFGGRGGG